MKNPFEQLRQRIRAHRAGIPYQPVQPAGAVAARKKEPGPIARLVDAWWTRLLSSIYEGSLSTQEAECESGETVRDYLWNTIGVGVWGAVFPVLTVVATQLAGPEQAGMFSMAFVAGTLLMILSNYGVRTFQVSDIDQTSSFNSYQVNRWLTSLLALGAGWLYCSLRGYDTHMFALSMGVYVYKIVDGLADVYEGRLQQEDKLYLGGISQALRSVLVIAVFSVLLFVTRSIGIAAIGMGIAAVASLILVTVPLALLETDPSAPWHAREVAGLFRQCFPLFSTLFLFNVIESMPKFAMESMLPYDAQLYFNALFFPAQGILITAGFMYKPQLLRLANIWSSPSSQALRPDRARHVGRYHRHYRSYRNHDELDRHPRHELHVRPGFRTVSSPRGAHGVCRRRYSGHRLHLRDHHRVAAPGIGNEALPRSIRLLHRHPHGARSVHGIVRSRYRLPCHHGYPAGFAYG